MKIPESEHTFANENQAIEACSYVNQSLRLRNKGETLAFRDGCRVWIRPEYATAIPCLTLQNFVDSLEKPMQLINYRTNKAIRVATQEEAAESVATSNHDGGAGVITVDGTPCYVA